MSLEVNVKLTVEDWRKFNCYVVKFLSKMTPESSRLKNFSKQFILWFFIAVVMMIALRNTDQLMKFHWPSALFALIFPVAYAFEFFKLNKKLQNKLRPSEQGSILAKQNYIFDEAGITNINSGYIGKYPWSFITNIERDNGLIMLFIDDIQAHILPESQLDNPNEVYSYITNMYELRKKY